MKDGYWVKIDDVNGYHVLLDRGSPLFLITKDGSY